MNVLIPGLRNSGEMHWQTIWQNQFPEQFLRVEQDNWDEPNCEIWIQKIEETLADYNKSELTLIGHSIGCIAIVFWLNKFKHKVKGLLLVAPSDADKVGFPKYIAGFSPIPLNKLNSPSILVASNNDHVTSLKRSMEFANNWGSKLLNLENAGHIEEKSGFGQWKEGFDFLKKFEI